MSTFVLERARVAPASTELLGLVSVSLHRDIRRVTAGLRIRVELSDAVGLVAARIESRCPEIVLVDTDLVGCPGGLCRLARSLRPEVQFVGLACSWSERETMLRECADVIVHKPIRDAEWTALFGRLGVVDITKAVAHTPNLAA